MYDAVVQGKGREDREPEEIAKSVGDLECMSQTKTTVDHDKRKPCGKLSCHVSPKLFPDRWYGGQPRSHQQTQVVQLRMCQCGLQSHPASLRSAQLQCGLATSHHMS